MEKMTCPVCGKDFDEKNRSFLENGNPVCAECAEAEAKRSEPQENAEESDKIRSQVKTEKQKQKAKLITISAIALGVILIVTACLVLFIPYEISRDCYYCDGGKDECNAKAFTEYLTGKKIYNHDCGNCENGYIKCAYCNGWGITSETTTNYNEWFG